MGFILRHRARWGLVVLGLLALAPSTVAAQEIPEPAPGPAAPAAPAEEEEPAERRLLPVEPVPDALLERRLSAVLARVDDFVRVAVDVEEGVVQLTGEVPRAEALENLEAFVQRFEGVVYVDNDVEVVRDVETRVTPAVAAVQEFLNDTIAFLPVLGIALLVLLACWGIGRLLTWWQAPYRWLRIRPLLADLFQRVIRLIFIGIGLVLALEILDVTALVGAVLGAAGVAGLAIGFAFRDIVENYLAGALLSVRQPFATGDLVLVGEQEGKVIRLTSRETVLMTLAGNHVRIPNATVFKSVVTNYTRNRYRRFEFTVGISSQEDLARAQAVGVDAIAALPGVAREPAPTAWVDVIGEWNVTMRYFGWVDQVEADFFKVRSEAHRLVKVALDQAGVKMPPPTRRIHLRRDVPTEAEAAPASQRQPPAAEQAQQVDVSVDTDIDEQVRADLAREDEQNLLRDK